MPRNPRDVVVPCPRGHRVRLAGGRRFWASAHCPVCRSRVDRFRTGRIGRALLNLRTPASGRRLDRALWVATGGYLLAVLVALVLVKELGDRWWPATTLLFGPRWALLLPLPLLAILAALRDRTLLPLLVLTGLLVVGPVMGVVTGWRSLLVTPRPGEDLRVVSFNIWGGGYLTVPPTELMLEWGADVAAFQECGYELGKRLQSMVDWHVDVRNSLCLVSRFEILDASQMERRVFQDAGGSALVVTYTLNVDGRPVRLTSVHLDTPRKGLALIRRGRLWEGIPWLRAKSELRTIEHRRARAWVDTFPAPQIVVGDFNTTVESQAYQDAWSDWRNAFSLVGHGLGGTRLNGWIRARIDHILVDENWTVVRSWLGDDVGSDHLPMLADIRLR